MSHHIVFFDGKCVLCKETKKIFMKLDWLEKAKWISIQDMEENKEYNKKYPTLNRSDLKKEMHLVTKSGKVYKGFFAVRRMAVMFPLTMVIGIVAYLPFVSIIGVPTYKYIANNRHKFLKATCEDGSCSIK